MMNRRRIALKEARVSKEEYLSKDTKWRLLWLAITRSFKSLEGSSIDEYELYAFCSSLGGDKLSAEASLKHDHYLLSLDSLDGPIQHWKGFTAEEFEADWDDLLAIVEDRATPDEDA